MTQTEMIFDLAERVGALRAALKWCLDHSHECLDDSPGTLASLREVYEETERQKKP